MRVDALTFDVVSYGLLGLAVVGLGWLLATRDRRATSRRYVVVVAALAIVGALALRVWSTPVVVVDDDGARRAFYLGTPSYELVAAHGDVPAHPTWIVNESSHGVVVVELDITPPDHFDRREASIANRDPVFRKMVRSTTTLSPGQADLRAKVDLVGPEEDPTHVWATREITHELVRVTVCWVTWGTINNP